MESYRGQQLLDRAVILRGIRLGVTVGVFVDAGALRVVGLDVLCGDGNHRFLPLSACDVGERDLEVDSALVLMDEHYYRDNSRSLAALRGKPVLRDGQEVGSLVDLVLGADGAAQELVVEAQGRLLTLPAGDGVGLGSDRLSRAV